MLYFYNNENLRSYCFKCLLTPVIFKLFVKIVYQALCFERSKFEQYISNAYSVNGKESLFDNSAQFLTLKKIE